MIDLLFLLLTFLGAVYLCFVMFMAFKERSMVVGIVAINLIIFIYTFLFAPQMITKYALSGGRIAAGAGYTMITYMFLHANVQHIFLNSLGLLFFGYHMEKEFTGPLTLLIYFVSGMFAAAVYVLSAPANVLVVGASGAIFGLMAYLTLTRPFKISPMPFIIPMPIAVASLLYVIFAAPVMATGGLLEGVAHNAHIGGLLGGSLLALAMNRQEALKGVIIVVLLAALIFILPPLFM
ncbi:MAG: rhomboid family intramembrane serine protease [archaeon]